MSVAVTILATLTLVILFWNRGSGFEKISTFLYACTAYAVAWLGAAVVLFQLYNGPIARLAAAHITASAVGLAGVSLLSMRATPGGSGRQPSASSFTRSLSVSPKSGAEPYSRPAR